jgi:hypothetical protein
MLAYALLGQGRCLAALGKPEAEEPLREAKELFASMGYGPALAETEALLAETAPPSSLSCGVSRSGSTRARSTRLRRLSLSGSSRLPSSSAIV